MIPLWDRMPMAVSKSLSGGSISLFGTAGRSRPTVLGIDVRGGESALAARTLTKRKTEDGFMARIMLIKGKPKGSSKRWLMACPLWQAISVCDYLVAGRAPCLGLSTELS